MANEGLHDIAAIRGGGGGQCRIWRHIDPRSEHLVGTAGLIIVITSVEERGEHAVSGRGTRDIPISSRTHELSPFPPTGIIMEGVVVNSFNSAELEAGRGVNYSSVKKGVVDAADVWEGWGTWSMGPIAAIDAIECSLLDVFFLVRLGGIPSLPMRHPAYGECFGFGCLR